MVSNSTSTIDDSVTCLAKAVWEHHQASALSKRTLVSISGIPGSGKSTLARRLAEKLNSIYLNNNCALSKAQSQVHTDLSNPAPTAYAIEVPMDGFHLSRAQLRELPDPATAVHRRGAAFTYDAASYCQLVLQLVQPIEMEKTGTIRAPAFDHATKDPVQDSIEIGTRTRIVILEGNYVNLDREPWNTVTKLFSLRLMVVVDRRVARERLVKRHVSSGICADEGSARNRVETTDDLNAEAILAHRVNGVLEVAV